MEALPALLGEMKAAEAVVKSATADLPPKRSYDDFTPAERAALTRATGLSPAQLREGMARAASRSTNGSGANDEG